ncbi:hypothetical protein TNCV_180801 [Trichonephila clavipes]|nr:hypothetical protein TNCV_180801 [Trichonephila clavipes]
MRTTPELVSPSPRYHITPTGGCLSSRASLPYSVSLYWYWARPRDSPAMTDTLTTRLPRPRNGFRNFEP